MLGVSQGAEKHETRGQSPERGQYQAHGAGQRRKAGDAIKLELPGEEVLHQPCRLLKQKGGRGARQAHQQSLHNDGLPLADVQQTHEAQQTEQAGVAPVQRSVVNRHGGKSAETGGAGRRGRRALRSPPASQ